MKRNFETKSIKNILGKLIDSSSNLNSGLNNIKVQKLWKEVMVLMLILIQTRLY